MGDPDVLERANSVVQLHAKTGPYDGLEEMHVALIADLAAEVKQLRGVEHDLKTLLPNYRMIERELRAELAALREENEQHKRSAATGGEQ